MLECDTFHPEVYRARLEAKHEVAIEILPGAFALDSDRVNRFQREAEVLASLNHPTYSGDGTLSPFACSRARLYPAERRARFMENTYKMAAKTTGTGFAPVLGGSL